MSLLPPLPPSPASSSSRSHSLSRSPPFFSPHSRASPSHSSPLAQSHSRESTTSTASSNSNQPIRLDSTSDEESASDEGSVEIYLTSSLNMSICPSERSFSGVPIAVNGGSMTSVSGPVPARPDDSPVLPSSIPNFNPQSSSFSSQQPISLQLQAQTLSSSNPIATATSPLPTIAIATSTAQTQIQAHTPPPPAPAQHTIPLPAISSYSPTSSQAYRHSGGAYEADDVNGSAQNGHAPAHGDVRENGLGHAHGNGNEDLAPRAASHGNVNAHVIPPSKPLLLPSSQASLSLPLPESEEFGGAGSGLPLSPPSFPAPAPSHSLFSSAQAQVFVPSNAHLLPPTSTRAPAPDPDPSPDPTGKTPNVYINGLPPHFPEDQLYALAVPFGAVRSVRTFTRHVRDCESGYGFVLFETVEAAEKCIVSLRRYRNLHPTFSKQAHKIPGTRPTPPLDIHLHPPSSLAHANSHNNSQWDGSEAGEVHEGEVWGSGDGDGDGGGGSAAFKARMESLADRNSTNLYMEGLPLSIDEATLVALVSPHRISSSRFFQTRLSNPPRIIAFVRFETRAGAEEIIERLHGRMVRGWNDAGSRISVRFADTAEQRELRRNERMAREGEESPARLTIAQAALLNLHGQDLRAPLTLPAPAEHARGYAHSHSSHSSPRVHERVPPFVVDYSIAPGRGGYQHQQQRAITPVYGHDQHHREGNLHPHPPAPVPAHHPHHHYSYPHHSPYNAHVELPPVSASSSSDNAQTASMDPAMAVLLESLRVRGTPYAGREREFASNRQLLGGYDSHPQQQSEHDARSEEYEYGHGYGHGARPGSRGYAPYVNGGVNGGGGTVSVRGGMGGGGYTATEEFIMRAHAEGQYQAQAQQNGNPHPNNSNLNHVQQQVRRRPAPPPLDLAPGNNNIGSNLRRRRDSDAGHPLHSNEHGHAVSAANGANGSGNGFAYKSGQAQYLGSGSPSLGMVPLVGEEEFHAGSGGGGSGRGVVKHNHRIHPAHVNVRLAQLEKTQQAQSPVLGSEIGTMQPYQQAHLRSSTLPHRSAPGGTNATRHFQHNSMSVAVTSGAGYRTSNTTGISSSSTTTNTSNMNTSNTNTNLNTHMINNSNNNNTSTGTSTNVNTNMNTTNTNTIQNIHTDSSSSAQAQAQAQTQALYDGHGDAGGAGVGATLRYHHPNHQQHHSNQNQHHGQGHGRTHSQSKAHAHAHHHSHPPAHAHHGHAQNHGHGHSHSQPQSHSRHSHSHSRSNHNDVLLPPQAQAQPQSHIQTQAHSQQTQVYLDSPTDSPSLVSPALTYSSQHSRDTPSTLSPATPFFSGLEPAGMSMQMSVEGAGKGGLKIAGGEGVRVGAAQ